MKKLFTIIIILAASTGAFAQKTTHDTTVTAQKDTSKIVGRDSLQKVSFLKDSVVTHDTLAFNKTKRFWWMSKVHQPTTHDSLFMADSMQLVYYSIDSAYKKNYDSTYSKTHDTAYTQPAPTHTSFGVMVADPSLTETQMIALTNAYGLKDYRQAIFLSRFTGYNKDLEQDIAAGLHIFINLNWELNQSTPRIFYRDTANYRKQVRIFCQTYGKQIAALGGCAVIENEVITKKYFIDDMANYLTLLKIGIEECHAVGLKVTNSGDHAGYYLAMLSGSWPSGKATEIANLKQLLTGYESLNLDYINLHTGGKYKYATGDIKKVADYIRTRFNKPVMVNEVVIDTLTNVPWLINELKAANLVTAIIYDGIDTGGEGAVPLHTGTTINTLGNTVIAAIK